MKKIGLSQEKVRLWCTSRQQKMFYCHCNRVAIIFSSRFPRILLFSQGIVRRRIGWRWMSVRDIVKRTGSTQCNNVGSNYNKLFEIKQFEYWHGFIVLERRGEFIIFHRVNLNFYIKWVTLGPHLLRNHLLKQMDGLVIYIKFTHC